MIANARMYSVTPQVAALWRELLSGVFALARTPVTLQGHEPPAPIETLWERPDMAAVFMCGLPYARTAPQPFLVAAPVPAPADFGGRPQYWSELVVRADSPFRTIEDTFGQRIAFTTPNSQSGCAAALYFLMSKAAPEKAADSPLYRELVAPRLTPQGAVTAVIEGAAEVAPIDAYAYALLQRYRPDTTAQLRIVAHTGKTAIPPLVGSCAPGAALQTAFLASHEDPRLQALMARLLLARFDKADAPAYSLLRSNYEAAVSYWSQRPLAETMHPAFAW